MLQIYLPLSPDLSTVVLDLPTVVPDLPTVVSDLPTVVSDLPTIVMPCNFEKDPPEFQPLCTHDFIRRHQNQNKYIDLSSKSSLALQ